MNDKFGLVDSGILFQQVWIIAFAKEFAFPRAAFTVLYCCKVKYVFLPYSFPPDCNIKTT